ncbi:hypothetical protein OHC33_003935 [Knufia fluminis]|uniref:Apple domain-containing protein n=1 Tax=Knufia fluminis TaxID=191047 RepID=A0AAN8ENC9_9EURO|nr:hypothetical protein OHC33_003935 [Knufia fluminis]
MIQFHLAISLMLIASILSVSLTVAVDISHAPLHLDHLELAVRDHSSTPTTATPTLPCGEANGTEFAGSNSRWTMLCDIDFFAQDIYPFLLAKSFESCLKYCEEYNDEHGEGKCAGFLFAPDRSNLDNDCYLKSSLNDAIYPSTLHLLGASLLPSTAASTVISPISPATESSAATTSITESIVTPPLLPTPSTEPTDSEKSPAQGGPVALGRVPTVTNSTYLGTSVDEVASQYVSHAPEKPQQLSGDMLEAGINLDLITDYPLASDTGTWTADDSPTHDLAEMTVTPRLSRDGGRGGNINGTNVFIFCDTSTYGEDKNPIFGYLNGFVSSSVAVDESMNALDGGSLSLINSLGQWQDDVGRMRGWVPMTTGEEAFNTAISGQGYRYAVWPNSSPISLNDTHAIIYAPLVYLEVDMQDQSSPRYTSLGNTLLLISIDPAYGPHADRLQNQFFTKDEVNWGSLGGIRGWSANGQESMDGDVYVFGQAETGILLGKVAASKFSDRDEYAYWNGESWSNEMPPATSTSNAFMIDQPADNTFYYRYLVGKDNSTLTINPPGQQGGDIEYVENLITNVWSEQHVLFTVPTPERGYAYAGGMHAGYFGTDDITNGGTKMLCTWTEHTEVDPEKPDSGYAHKSQIIELGWLDG